MPSVESLPPGSLPAKGHSTVPHAGSGPLSDRRAGRLHSLTEVLDTTDEKLRSGRAAGARVFPTGFEALDMALSGGLRSGELVLIGGPQGLGKTAMALQLMRNAVAARRSAVLFSYEHDAHSILERLIAIEAAAIAGTDAVGLTKIRQAFEARHSRAHTLQERFAGMVGGAEAVAALGSYGDRLHVHTSSGVRTTLFEIERTVKQVIDRDGVPPLVVIDYLQKVPVAPASGSQPTLSEEERVTVVVEGLKDLALEYQVPVLTIVAAEKGSLAPGTRMRVHDLRGSSALAYEADVILILNDKYDVVAKHHLVYNVGNADRYRQWVVLSVEKNRSGADHLDLEFQKRFEQGRFEPEGRVVQEQLVEERIYRD